ncbi:MAG TPA: Fic family protein [Micropepsaceae bacterium]|nr:Fic family protein [Micropepsaceae bacterium]
MPNHSVKRRISGTYESVAVAGEAVKAFIPHSLPPLEPPLLIEGALASALVEAASAMHTLAQAASFIPSLEWFLYAFVRKEAVLSSQIEGTQSTLDDLFEAEAHPDETPAGDLAEVSAYLAALAHARNELGRTGGLPLSMRLLNGAHRLLMRGKHGEGKHPGELRRSQNWIGGPRPSRAVHVPPPPHHLPSLLGDLEKFIHGEPEMPLLVKAALVHAQFETIHPYLDGNGRVGRLLIALMLEEGGIIDARLVTISTFFREHRPEYYRRLNAVREVGDFEGWTTFFLDAITASATNAAATARDIGQLVTRDRTRVHERLENSAAAARLFETLPLNPMITIARAMALVRTSKPTAIRAVETLLDAGILAEITGRKRDRVFVYRAYVERLKGQA